MKKKLLFVINTMGRAGAETALIELLHTLVRMDDYEIHLYAMIPCGELYKKVPSEVIIENKRFSTASILSIHGKTMILWTVIKAFIYRFHGFLLIGDVIKNIRIQKNMGGRLQYDKLLWRIISSGQKERKDSYELGVAFIEGASTYYLADKVSANKKVSFVHIDYEKAGYNSITDKKCYEPMDRIYVVSNEVGDKFLKVYPRYKDKVTLFRNLLNKEEIRKKAGLEDVFQDDYRGYRIVSVGRLHYQKGYDIAVEVVAKLKSSGYNIRWYVLGEGLERKNLEKLRKQYGVENEFFLLGAKENPYPYMKQCNLYAQLSRFEGKSIAIEEAQILGKAIVASNCTGNREQIQDGYDGTLVALDVDSIVEKIRLLIDNPLIQKRYEEHVLGKELNFPQDLNDMLTLLHS